MRQSELGVVAGPSAKAQRNSDHTHCLIASHVAMGSVEIHDRLVVHPDFLWPGVSGSSHYHLQGLKEDKEGLTK